MAKIKDIAKKMNLSVSTVYKAFNGAADINEETRKNIYKTAQEDGSGNGIYTGRQPSKSRNEAGLRFPQPYGTPSCDDVFL